ncbi:MAG: hypothetical protein BM485_15410 [Desulfobulbaceae bacterium DB1]|nr:MAG: hypothetical protein BM485_15410 [Desulfobulbaceae bacterium DB1]
MSDNLNPLKALIFRIVHMDNVQWILRHGMYCRNSSIQDLEYRTIGNPELINKRQYRDVPINPGGTLSDYIPFYFTPFSPMMYNIKTGYAGITKVPNEKVVIFVSSLHKLNQMENPFVFTDRHAYLLSAQFYSELVDLERIDWPLLQSRNFQRDPDDPGKLERYQAEALIYQHLPIEKFIGAVCYTDQGLNHIQKLANGSGIDLQVKKLPGWYF